MIFFGLPPHEFASQFPNPAVQKHQSPFAILQRCPYLKNGRWLR